jgi:uncharacterized protein with beta-barrel porin domain
MKAPLQQLSPEKGTVDSKPFQRLALHSAVAAALLGGAYGRAAYAGSCTPGPVSVCSGPANNGVDTTQNLTGTALTVTTNAGFGIDTSSTGGNGLQLLGVDGLAFVDTNSSKITGNYRGIDAQNNGGGTLSIVSSGAVAGVEGVGISATNYGADLTLQTAAVTGGDKGIYARNYGSGALSITSTGTVTSDDSLYITVPTGIVAINSRDGTNLTLQTAAVTGRYTGIFADNQGSGALRIASSGPLTGTVYSGITAWNASYGTDLTIQTGAVTGGTDGIFASNSGSGALNITSTGEVTTSVYSYNGISARNNGTDLTLQTEVVTGGYRGIYALNKGDGKLSVTSNGAVTATRDAGKGIYSRNYGSDLILQVTDVSGIFRGIGAYNHGNGVLSISSTGGVMGGIFARNYGTELTLNTAMVESGSSAIVARNEGSGALSITSTGDVIAGGYGIFATSDRSELNVSTAAVTAGATGIYARNVGSGGSNITSEGVVTGGDSGIRVIHRSESEALTITTLAAVTGGVEGIYAGNFGGGAMNVTSLAAVSATTYSGIAVTNRGKNLTIQSTSVTGATGISARNSNGPLSMTSSGTVTGTSRNGISAINYGYGTDLTLQANTVMAESIGIYARNRGVGALNITTSGLVTGSQGSGIYAENIGTDLTLHTAAVTGADNAIEARNHGTGALSITTGDVVTSTGRSGIFAENFGTDLTLHTAAVIGGGIRAYNYGSGALSITANDVVMGIRAKNTGTDLTVDTKAVIGDRFGIVISHEGDGRLSVTTDGVVTGRSDNALLLNGFVAGIIEGSITNNGGLVSSQAAAVVMTRASRFGGEFNNNADITGGNGTAFDVSLTTHGIVLNQYAGTITGNVLLGSGDDKVTIIGGTINGQIIGQGSGVVTVDVGAGNGFQANGVVNVADYVIQSGTVQQVADFSTAASTTTVADGATLSFSSLISGGGALVSNGDLAFVLNADSAGKLSQQGTVTLNSGSTISVETNGVLPNPNESIQLISATNIIDNGVVLNTDLPDSESLLYVYQALINSDSVSIAMSVADLGAISPLQNPSAFGDSMTAFVNGGGNNAVVDLLADLGAGDVAGFEQVADVFSPSVSGAVSQGAREANDSTWRLINERLVGSETALPAGEPTSGVWLQGYGGTTDQDASDHVEGFDADTSGIALGYDLDRHQWRVGAAFSAGDTNIDNDRFAHDRIDIESKQFIVYGGFWQDQWFFNATASAAALDYDFKRNNMISGEGPIKSDTDGDLFGMSVGGGYAYRLSDHVILTPQLSLRYTALDVDDYTEDGGLDLRVAYDDLDTLASELGISAQAQYGAGKWQLAPTARLAWVHDYLNENEQATARYAGQSYIQQGLDPDQDVASLGLGMAASNAHGVSVSLDYRGVLGSDYSSNQGWLNVRYEF